MLWEFDSPRPHSEVLDSPFVFRYPLVSLIRWISLQGQGSWDEPPARERRPGWRWLAQPVVQVEPVAARLAALDGSGTSRARTVFDEHGILYTLHQGDGYALEPK